jgi:hypothetical protein
MTNASILGAVALMAAVAATPVAGTAIAAALPGPAASGSGGGMATADSAVEEVQYRGGYRYGPRPGFAPRPYVGPRYYGGPRAYGRPAWGYRPWYRRPYYGTIIGGVALGTIIGVTAYGLAPRPPRPDLCWYWADEGQSRGYWDYC